MEKQETFEKEFEENGIQVPDELLKEIQKLAIMGLFNDEFFEMLRKCLEEPTLNSIKYLLSAQFVPSYDVLKMAIEVGNFKAFIMLLNRYCCYHSNSYYDQICMFAEIFNDLCPCMAGWGRVEFLEWWFSRLDANSDMEEHVNPNLDYVSEEAAFYGCFNVLSWMLERGLPISSDAYIGAILGQRNDVFEWLENNKVCKRLKTIVMALLEIGAIDWLERDYNFEEAFEESILNHYIKIAIQNEQKESLKWLLAKYGHSTPPLDMVRFAIKHGLEFIEILAHWFGDDEIYDEFESLWAFFCAKNIPIESWQWFFDHNGQIDKTHLETNLTSRPDLITFFLEELPVLCKKKDL
jgi:hypothetical protein